MTFMTELPPSRPLRSSGLGRVEDATHALIASVLDDDPDAMERAVAQLRGHGWRAYDIWQVLSKVPLRRARRRANPLSEREQEIMLLVARGMSNPSIGKALHISAATVKTYLDRTFKKVGCSDRTAAVVAVLHNGWIENELDET